MATRNWTECPSCGHKAGCLDDYSKPAGCVMHIKCNACRQLDNKPRTPVTLGVAVAWARKQIEANPRKQIYVRDLQTRSVITLTARNIGQVSVDEPDRKVIAVAVS